LFNAMTTTCKEIGAGGSGRLRRLATATVQRFSVRSRSTRRNSVGDRRAQTPAPETLHDEQFGRIEDTFASEFAK